MTGDTRDLSAVGQSMDGGPHERAVGGVGASVVEGIGAEVIERLGALTRQLLDADSVGGVLEHVVSAALGIVPAADLVSVTLRAPDGSFHTPVQSDPRAWELDQIQYTTGEGPCVEAARPTGPSVAHSGDLARDPRWPEFGRAAAAHGYDSLLAIALLPDARPPRLSGALNLYCRAPDSFTDADRDRVLLLATHASLALATTNAVTTAELREAHLRRAIDTRDVIGQAKGILMSRRGISAEEAFDVLRRASQDLNAKLADVARALVAGGDPA